MKLPTAAEQVTRHRSVLVAGYVEGRQLRKPALQLNNMAGRQIIGNSQRAEAG